MDEQQVLISWAVHVRRKFLEAKLHYPKAAEMVQLIGDLYTIETEGISPSIVDPCARMPRG